MRTFTSLEIRFEYVLVGKLPNRRIYVAKYARVTPALQMAASREAMETNIIQISVLIS